MITAITSFSNTLSLLDGETNNYNQGPTTFDPRLGLGIPSYTSLPDVFFDEIAPHLSGAELKVMLYIMRRTYGFKKRQDGISYSQFLDGITCRDGRKLDLGAGIKSDRTLSAALDNLCDKWHLLFRHRQTRPDGLKSVTIYELNLDGQSHYQPEQPTGEPECDPDSTPARNNPNHRTAANAPTAPGQNTAKIADRGTAKIADRGTAKIADTTNSVNNKQFKQHTESASAPEQLVCEIPEGKPAKRHIPDTILSGENQPAKAAKVHNEQGYDTLIKAGVKPAKARQFADSDPNYLERLIETSKEKTNPGGYIVTMLGLGAEPRPTTTRSRHEPSGIGQRGIDIQKYTTGKYAFLTQSDSQKE